MLAKTEAELAGHARALAPLCAPGRIVALTGDLGAGKTALVRALIRHISGDPDLDVPSPTYTLVQTYDTPDMPVWHFDLYRLKDPQEVFELGWEDALASNALLLIEWPERLGALLPANALNIVIDITQDGTRRIEVST